MDANTVRQHNEELEDGLVRFFHENIMRRLVRKGHRSVTDVYRVLQAVKDSPDKIADFLKVLDETCHIVKIEKPEVPPLLEMIGTVVIPATTSPIFGIEKFKLKRDGGICSYLGENFCLWFRSKTEDLKTETTLRYVKLTHNSLDKQILDEFREAAETSLAEMFAMMEAQATGKEGNLLVNGFVNIFYIRDANNVLRAVYVYWCVGGWGVRALSVEDSDGWLGGFRVFSRNS